MRKFISVFFTFSFLLIFNSCDKNKNIVLFSIQDDVKLGQQVSAEIESHPATYPVLSMTEYPEAYTYLNDIVNDILNSGKVVYRDEFAWDVKIIHDDEILNAFATPGGFIYVYTGLIKYLESEDHLAGVIGHEIAHADLRHGSRNLQTQYGISFLLGLILGENPGSLEQIAGQVAGTLAGLTYSRNFESEADDNSVIYLAETNYACNGAAGFFRKIQDEGQCNANFVWLSTHPDPCDRIESIDQKAGDEQCSTTELAPPSYQDFINSLP